MQSIVNIPIPIPNSLLTFVFSTFRIKLSLPAFLRLLSNKSAQNHFFLSSLDYNDFQYGFPSALDLFQPI